MLSPLTREESCTSRLTTSAPIRFAASSKDTRVRVEGSVNRFATVTPASALLVGGGLPSGRTNPCALFRRRSISLRGKLSRVSRCRKLPSARRCSIGESFMGGTLACQPPLEDYRCGSAVDIFPAHTSPTLAAGALGLERRGRLERRPALINHAHGN